MRIVRANRQNRQAYINQSPSSPWNNVGLLGLLVRVETINIILGGRGGSSNFFENGMKDIKFNASCSIADG